MCSEADKNLDRRLTDALLSYKGVILRDFIREVSSAVRLSRPGDDAENFIGWMQAIYKETTGEVFHEENK